MRILIYFITLIFLTGCAITGSPTFYVNVDSLASSNAKNKKTYLLIPGNQDVTWNDLQFQEYASYVMRVLDAKGFVSAQSADEADLAIILSYGIGDPQTHQYSYSMPTWGKTGVSSANTYGTATTAGNTTSVNATTVYTPTYGVTGYQTHTGTRTSYFRYAMMTGYDLEAYKETQEQTQLWKTSLTSSGSSGDLRQVFPILIAASVPYIAVNTGKRIDVQLKESDEIVDAVKGISQ